MSLYIRHGYENREEYLLSLASEYNVSATTVHLLSEQFGEDEDFGLLQQALDELRFGDIGFE